MPFSGKFYSISANSHSHVERYDVHVSLEISRYASTETLYWTSSRGQYSKVKQTKLCGLFLSLNLLGLLNGDKSVKTLSIRNVVSQGAAMGNYQEGNDFFHFVGKDVQVFCIQIPRINVTDP